MRGTDDSLGWAGDVRDGSQDSKADIMSNVQLIEQAARWEFNEWSLVEKKRIRTSHEGGSPNYPDIYEIRRSTPFSRLNGETCIIYIGFLQEPGARR